MFNQISVFITQCCVLLQSAVTSGCKEVSEPIGVLYVEWGSKVGGLPKARRIYNE